MESIWKRQVNGVQAQRLALFSRYGVDVEALFDDIGHIAATSQLSATPSAPSALLFLLHLDEAPRMLQKLEDMHVQTASTADSHEEKYRGALIRYLGLSDLPYLLFGRDFSVISSLNCV